MRILPLCCAGAALAVYAPQATLAQDGSPPTTTESPADSSGSSPATSDGATQPSLSPDTQPATAPVAESAGARGQEDLPPLPVQEFPDDVLALGTSFEIVAAAVDVNAVGQAGNDVDDEDLNLALAVATRYFRGYEATKFGYSVLLRGSESFSRAPSTDGSLYLNQLNLTAQPETRYYPLPNNPLFIHGTVDLDVGISSTKDTGVADTSDSIGPGQVGFVLGVGAGRVLAIDPVVRVRRLEMAMKSEGLLAGDIDPATGTAIIRDWYALRNDFTNYRRLAYAMKHLRSAGLRGEPNLRAMYKAREVIADPFIVNRRRGWDARAGIGVVQPFIAFDNADEPDASFAFLASGQYELPMATDRQLSLLSKVSVDVGDSADAPRAWSARVFATLTQVFYNEYFDPIGQLSVNSSAGVAGVRVDGGGGPKAGADITTSAAYSRVLNRGSFATAAANLRLLNDGTFVLGFSLGYTFGVASGFYIPYYAGSLVKQ